MIFVFRGTDIKSQLLQDTFLMTLYNSFTPKTARPNYLRFLRSEKYAGLHFSNATNNLQFKGNNSLNNNFLWDFPKQNKLKIATHCHSVILRLSFAKH